MKSSFRRILPEVRLSPRAYRLGIPGGGNLEDETDPAVRLNRLEETYRARLAVLDARFSHEKQEAFTLGVRQGREEAERETAARFDAQCRHWAGLVRQLTQARQDACRVSEAQLVDLVIMAVERLVAARPPDPELIARTLREAFDLLVTKDKVAIVCSPADAVFVRDLLAGHREEFEEIEKFTVREDPAMSPGGCLVETEWGTIDARVEKRLAVIKQLWREAAVAPAEDVPEDEA